MRSELRNGEEAEFYISISITRKENAKFKHKGYSMKKFHKHDHYEIMNIYSANNNAILYLCDKKYTIPANSFILIPPHTEHYTERNLHSNRLILSLSQKYAQTIFDFLEIDLKSFFSNNVLVYSNAQINELYSIGKEILFEMNKTGNEKASSTIRALTAKFIDILSHNLTNQESRFYHIQDSPVYSVINYLKKNYAQRITLDDISEKFLTNKFYLCKQFKKEIGLSVIEFLIQTRINHARDFLENSTLTLAEIAYKTGFESTSYFSRAFKSLVGISPGRYRKQFYDKQQK